MPRGHLGSLGLWEPSGWSSHQLLCSTLKHGDLKKKLFVLLPALELCLRAGRASSELRGGASQPSTEQKEFHHSVVLTTGRWC